jgi:hypothetical protein
LQKYKDEENDIMCCMMLVGNKADLVTDQHGVTLEDHQAMAARHSLLEARTSAKTGLNVDHTFTRLVVGVYELKRKKRRASTVGSVSGKDDVLDLDRKTEMSTKNMTCC